MGLISSSPLTHLVPPCIFHIILLCESYSIVVPHGHIFVATSPSSRLLVYPFLLSGRSRCPTRNRSFNFSCSRLGRADTFSFQYLPSTPRISLKCFSFTLFLSVCLSRFSTLSFTFVLYPPNFSVGQYLFLVSPYFFSTTLSRNLPYSFQVMRAVRQWHQQMFIALYRHTVLSGYPPYIGIPPYQDTRHISGYRLIGAPVLQA